MYYRGKELKDDTETVATLRILIRDTLHVKELKDTTCIDLDSETDKPATKKAKRNEGSAFEGTLLGGGGSSSRKDETNSAAEDQQQPREASKEPMCIDSAATVKPCSLCTFDNPLTNSQCEVCETPFPQVF